MRDYNPEDTPQEIILKWSLRIGILALLIGLIIIPVFTADKPIADIDYTSQEDVNHSLQESYREELNNIGPIDNSELEELREQRSQETNDMIQREYERRLNRMRDTVNNEIYQQTIQTE